MTWKTDPTTGHIRGTVVDRHGLPLDQIRVTVRDISGKRLLASRLTVGSGWFGFVDLAPGRYKLTVDDEDARGRHMRVVKVAAGELETVPFVIKVRE